MSRTSWGRVCARARQVMTTIIGVTLVLILPHVAVAQDFRFTSFEITGNQRVDASTILSYAGLEQGQTVTAGELNDAYQRILDSGLFEEVALNPDGTRLVIEVQEFPTINQINIEGNRSLDDDVLEPLLGSRPRLVYTPSQAEADALAITEAYTQSGRLSASVQPRIIRRSDNRVDLVFEVSEGGVVENERISFVGNRQFSDRRLRRVLATKQAGILRRVIRADTFIEDRIQFDIQLLTDFYRARGYADFQVLSASPELARERDAVFITFTLQEGQKFSFNEVTASSEVAEVDIALFNDVIDLRAGDTFSPVAVERTIRRLEDTASDLGLNFIRVTPRITRNDAFSTLDIDFAIERGPRIFVERIDIEGNTTTLDRVIRRQFDTVEGDPFNPREIREASERIRALGLFETTDVQTREGSSPDTVIVDVDVQDGPTGSLSFGGSYSVDGGFGLVITLVERNLLGRGQTLGLTFNGAEDDRQFSINFVEPAFLGRNVAFLSDFFYITSDNSNQDFDTVDIGFLLGLGFPVSERGRLRVNLGYKSLELSDLDEDRSSPILLREQGTEKGGVFGYSYSFDTRRTGLNPSAGVLLRFGQDIEGVGVDGAIVRTTAAAIGEYAAFGEDVIFRAALEGGVVTGLGDSNTRATDRFFLSRRLLRGFAANGVGPRDTEAPNEDALGGNYFVSGRVEAQFPSGLPEEYNVDLGLFFDAGSLWGLDDTAGFNGTQVDDSFSLRTSVGLSIFWETPIGPLRFNFSRALQKEDYDEESNFDFTISTQF